MIRMPYVRPVLAKLAASTLVLGVTMVGCKPATEGSRPRSAAQAVTPEQIAANAGRAAAAALGRGDLDAAVRLAETAVSLSPRDAGHRTTLAELYLKSGRFDSAAAAYRDALQLNPGDPRASLSLALTEIGIGENDKAVATLKAANGQVAPADHGLALALAGDKQGAIALLTAAARADGATARVRQNLALAHALAGDWAQARTIAAQDVPADELDARMTAWAEFASPKQSYDQVATLLGVVPVADGGQPARLALNGAEAAVQLAAAQTGSEAIVVNVAEEPVAIAQADMPTPVETFAPADVASANVAPAQAEPALAAALASVESVLPRQMARPVTRTIRAAASAPRSLKGRYVVQLGAFASNAGVERAWNGAVGKLDQLSDYVPASTRFSVGRSAVTRLSVGGFATRNPATELCNSLRRAGGHCFVRMTAGDAPVRWASRAIRNG